MEKNLKDTKCGLLDKVNVEVKILFTSLSEARRGDCYSWHSQFKITSEESEEVAVKVAVFPTIANSRQHCSGHVH